MLNTKTIFFRLIVTGSEYHRRNLTRTWFLLQLIIHIKCGGVVAWELAQQGDKSLSTWH